MAFPTKWGQVWILQPGIGLHWNFHWLTFDGPTIPPGINVSLQNAVSDWLRGHYANIDAPNPGGTNVKFYAQDGATLCKQQFPCSPWGLPILGPRAPLATTVMLKKFTAIGGRAGRGYWMQGNVPFIFVKGSRLIPSGVTAYENFGLHWLTPLVWAGRTFTLAHVSYSTGQLLPVTDVRVDARLHYRHRWGRTYHFNTNPFTPWPPPP